MPNTVLIGAQWGDEGKGKLIDVLTADVGIIARYQGGNNAGHTVKIGEEQFVLHLIPSGILRDDKLCIVGNGVVVDPAAFLDEVEYVRQKNIRVDGRLFVSDRAQMVFPYHRALDEGRETQSAAGEKIGTTKRGIGPTYGDKATRRGLRIGDMLEADFPEQVASRVRESNKMIEALGGKVLDVAQVVATYKDLATRMKPYIADTITMLNDRLAQGEHVLFEGAQGTMLDIDFGTYPFVTSSNATAGGACTGTGVAPNRIERVVGVIKAYTTRVGEGPFPTELTDATGKLLGERGREFGATTGRPRRCGWFDAVVGRYSAVVNGVDYWAITKLDVLDTVKTLKICVAYECDGQRLTAPPSNIHRLERCQPIYEEMPGWESATTDVTRYEDLPERAKQYVARLCELTGVKLGILSVGPKRESTLRIAL